MGFKIRDKSLFYTKNGWKNNWEPKIVNMPRAINPTDTSFLISRQDHHSFLRSMNPINIVYQSYRNYSRICRQYFYGDKHMEQALTLELRHAFRIPYECETPVDLIKHGAVTYPLWRKEEWLINSIDSMNFFLIIITPYSCKLMNFKMLESEQKTKSTRPKKEERKPCLMPSQKPLRIK